MASWSTKLARLKLRVKEIERCAQGDRDWIIDVVYLLSNRAGGCEARAPV